jgi:DNA-binding transcriptional regulator LsrR (DeoR family)
MMAADRRDLVTPPVAAEAGFGIETPVDLEEQLATRAAWLYFIAENTQAQIGKKLGLTRLRVNRLLAEAKRRGLVQITIAGRLADAIKLEDALKSAYGLRDAVVVPAAAEGEKLRAVIAAAAGHYLGQQLRDGMTVGVGWGQTLRHSLSFVPHRTYKKLSVVSLIGGLTQASAVNPHETASHLADIVGGQCFYIAAPVYADSAATRNLLLRQPLLQDVFERGRNIDLAFLSVGEVTRSGTMSKLGLISEAEVESLSRAGATGDYCSHWLGEDGKPVRHALNDRAVAMPLSFMSKIPHIVLVSGGRNKVVMINGVLRAGLANSLVTDEATARALLALAPA